LFPVICDFNGCLATAQNEKQLELSINNFEGDSTTAGSLIDISRRPWSVLLNYKAISPLTGRQKWKKKEIIDLFNNSSLAKQSGMNYSTKSLSAKRLDRVIKDIADLISTAGQ